MRDESGTRVGRGGWLRGVAIVSALAVATPAGAQRVSGVGQVQYQRLEGVQSGFLNESWIKSFESDYAHALPQQIELSAHLRFTEQTYVGRQDRLRAPEGSVRLAHRYAGIFSAYRPTNVRDLNGITTRQQNLTFTGYAQKPGLPSLSASWIRSHLDAVGLSPGVATVTRTVSALHTLPHLGLHAGYGDRLLETDTTGTRRRIDRHVNLGGVSQLRFGRAPLSLQYDFLQAWATPTPTHEQTSRVHTLAANTSYQWTPRTSSGLSYTYTRSVVLDQPGTLVQQHNGSAALSHNLTNAWSVSTGAGVRSAQFGGTTLTERFVTGATAVQAQARPGWSLGASAGHTINWLPHDRGRASDGIAAQTAMRLARGLDARADASFAWNERPRGATDSLQVSRETGRQFGVGLAAQPLRTVYVDGSVHRAHAGTAGIAGGTSSTSYLTNWRLTPTPRFQMSGAWSRTTAAGSHGTTLQANVLWAWGSRLQATGSYNRARQVLAAPLGVFVPLPASQESFFGTLTVGLARTLSSSVRYGEANRGLANHSREINVTLVKRFGG